MCVLKEEGETYQIGNKWTQQIFFMKGNFYMNTSTSFCKQNAESIRQTSPDQSEAEPCLHWPMRGRGWSGALMEGNKSPAIVLLSSHTSGAVIDWPHAFKYDGAALNNKTKYYKLHQWNEVCPGTRMSFRVGFNPESEPEE